MPGHERRSSRHPVEFEAGHGDRDGAVRRRQAACKLRLMRHLLAMLLTLSVAAAQAEPWPSGQFAQSQPEQSQPEEGSDGDTGQPQGRPGRSHSQHRQPWHGSRPLPPAPVPAQGQPAALWVSDHDGFSRVMVDFDRPEHYRLVRSGDHVTVLIDGGPVVGSPQGQSRNVQSVEGGAGQIDFTVVPGAALRDWRQGGLIVIEVLNPPPQALLPAARVSPPPAATPHSPAGQGDLAAAADATSLGKTPQPPTLPLSGAAQAPPIPKPLAGAPSPAVAPPPTAGPAADNAGQAPPAQVTPPVAARSPTAEGERASAAAATWMGKSPPPPAPPVSTPAQAPSAPMPPARAPPSAAADPPPTAGPAAGSPARAPPAPVSPSAAAVRPPSAEPPPVSAGPAADSGAFLLPFGPEVGAAAFRRGNAAVLVFDQRRAVDLSPLRGDPVFGAATVETVAAGTVIRLPLAQGMALSLSRDGSVWRIAAVPAPPKLSPIRSLSDDGKLTLSALSPGAVLSITDPDTGSTLLVGTERRPGEGVAVTRRMPEFSLLQTWQGVAVDPLSDSLDLRVIPDGFRLTGGKDGLSLSMLPEPGSGAGDQRRR